jgi:hypothetical protein
VVSVTPRPRFTPGERTPGTHCTGCWVRGRDDLNTEARGKNYLPLPGIEPRQSSPQSNTILTELPQLLYIYIYVCVSRENCANGDLFPEFDMNFSCLVTDSCEHRNEPPSAITGTEFIGQLNDCLLPNKDCTPWSYL